jgi:hypothetical protein
MNHETALSKAKEIAERVLAPIASQNDKEGRFSSEAVDALGQASRDYATDQVRGCGLGPRTFAAVTATLAEADAQISKAGGDFELVERDIPEPGPGQVRVKVEVCGICHSDVLVKKGSGWACNTRGCRVTKLAAALMLLEWASRPGKKAIALGLAGTVAMILSAMNVDAAISPCASIAR